MFPLLNLNSLFTFHFSNRYISASYRQDGKFKSTIGKEEKRWRGQTLFVRLPTSCQLVCYQHRYLPALRLISGPRSNIPIFDGCERGALVDDWLFKAEQVANLRGLTDAEKLEAFVPRLTGEARKFHSTKLAQIKDYDEWRQMMVAKFSTFFSKSFYLQQLETLKQKPNQSVRVFAREIDSLFVKALGLNVVSDRSLRGLKCRIKLNNLLFGLRDCVLNEIHAYIWMKKGGRLPSWASVVDSAQDLEWLIDLKQAKESSLVSSEWVGEGYTKVYISVSAVTGQSQRVAGYSVFFDENDSHKYDFNCFMF